MAIATATTLDSLCRRQAAVRRRLLQARAAGADDALRPQRRRQVDPAADPRRGAVARLREPRPAKGARVALHDQRPPRDAEISLGDYVFSGRAEMLATEAELERLEAAMGARRARRGDDARLRGRPGAARGRRRLPLARRGARRPDRPRLRRAGASAPLTTFSGGELTRASLARALATRPDLLLLDEPTNHLDIPSLEWLERYLVGLDAAIVLVAHDRWFLEAVGTSVLELEARRGRFFSGPWHAWRKEQAAREIALGKAIERQQAEIARMERFVERFRYKATKAKQAQSRVKQIERIKRDAVRPRPRDRRDLRFSFAAPERAGRVVLKMEKGTIEVPGRVLLDDASLEVERGEHVVLVGPNGAGKTTLIETLAGQREPAAGKVRTATTSSSATSPSTPRRRRGGHRARGGPARDRPHRPEGPRPARRLPLLRRRRGEEARRHLRRRAAPPLAGDPGRLRRQRADPRRADQPPRHREPRGARGRAARRSRGR